MAVLILLAITVLILFIIFVVKQRRIKKRLHETRIVQLKNGKYVVYQFMQYVYCVDSEFGDTLYKYDWKPYGYKDMAEKDPITHKEVCYFSNMADAIDLKLKIDNYYKKKKAEAEQAKKIEAGFEIADPSVLK